MYLLDTTFSTFVKYMDDMEALFNNPCNNGQEAAFWQTIIVDGVPTDSIDIEVITNNNKLNIPSPAHCRAS